MYRLNALQCYSATVLKTLSGWSKKTQNIIIYIYNIFWHILGYLNTCLRTVAL